MIDYGVYGTRSYRSHSAKIYDSFVDLCKTAEASAETILKVKRQLNDIFGVKGVKHYFWKLRKCQKAKKRSIRNNAHPLRSRKCKHGRTQRTRR